MHHPKASLTVVGSGIKFLAHLTQEAEAYIKKSNKVLFSVNEPAMREWIQRNNKNSESMDELYFEYTLRKDSYQAITQKILEELKQNQHLCVVFYGHPTVFAQSALDAVIQARSLGYEANVLPGIAADACLFADLLIDPSSCGYQSFEATDFLIHQRKYDPSCHLVLWQVSFIGITGHPCHENLRGLELLKSHLMQNYHSNHECYLYEAAQYPGFPPKIEKVKLIDLTAVKMTLLSTLYVPPFYKAKCDTEILNKLNLKFSDLEVVL